MTPGNVDDSASGCHSDALRCNVLSVEYKYGTKAFNVASTAGEGWSWVAIGVIADQIDNEKSS